MATDKNVTDQHTPLDPVNFDLDPVQDLFCTLRIWIFSDPIHKESTTLVNRMDKAVQNCSVAVQDPHHYKIVWILVAL